MSDWNACGRIGSQARSATFVTKACPEEGTFRDGRNGGECWKCPEDFSRTGNPVTGVQACKTAFTYEPAINRGDFACGPGEIFDFIDGGTCWKCPDGGKRTWDGIKSNTACRVDRMQWAMPNRQTYGIFGLGGAADDILAKMIAERTPIDDAITKLAQETNKPVATVSQNVWRVINATPEKSPVLSALLQVAVIDLAKKPVAQQTADEKALLAKIAQLIQWNRQFIAYQAKQAHDTWVRASQAYYNEALSKMGAAAIYADSMVTPPDYNEVLAGSIQVGAGVAGPVAAALVTTLWKDAQIFIRPFAEAAREAGKEIAKDVALGVAEGAADATGSATAAAAGPLLIAIAAAVIVTMEVDKFMALEKAEAQIANSIRIADRPVDMRTLLQSPDGPDEFLFHWTAVLGAETRPGANFNSRLAFYKTGKSPAASSLPSSANIPGVHTDAQMDDLNAKLQGMFPGGVGPAPGTMPSTTSNTGPVTTGVTTTPVAKTGNAAGQGSAWAQEDSGSNGFANLVQQAVTAQPRTAPAGAMHIEVTNRPRLCIAKSPGTDNTVKAMSCASKQVLWIAPDATQNVLVAAEKYCLVTNGGKSGSGVVVGRCPEEGKKPRKDAGTKWQLTQDGLIQQVDTDQCMTLTSSMGIVLQTCGSQRAMQVWRPFAISKAAAGNVANEGRKPGRDRP